MHQYPLNQLAFRAEIKVVLFEESSKPTLCYPTPLRGKIGRGQRKVGLQRKPQDSAPQVSIILFNDETPIAAGNGPGRAAGRLAFALQSLLFATQAVRAAQYTR
jgi:hypothetical protein